jgi:hypothetical protein
MKMTAAPSLFFLNYAKDVAYASKNALPVSLNGPNTLPLMAQQQLNHG